MNNNTIKNIIFDLGGVIFDVDYNLTLQKFRGFGTENFDHIYTQLKQTSLFDGFEIGEISANDFYERLRNELNSNISDEKIKLAWNAMLLGLPKERLDLVEKLSKKYRVFLLSNTNEIHLPEVKKIIFDSLRINDFDSFFENTYYSHLIGKRKPNADIFEFVLRENNLKKEETIFADDTPQHIEGAKKINLPTIFITKKYGILEHFSSWV